MDKQLEGVCKCNADTGSTATDAGKVIRREREPVRYGTIADEHICLFGLCKSDEDGNVDVETRTPLTPCRDYLIPSLKNQFASFSPDGPTACVAIVRRIGRIRGHATTELRHHSVCLSIESMSSVQSELHSLSLRTQFAEESLPIKINLGALVEESVARALHSNPAPVAISKAKAILNERALNWIVEKAKLGFILADVIAHAGPAPGTMFVQLTAAHAWSEMRRFLLAEVPLLAINDLKLSSADSALSIYTPIPASNYFEIESEWTLDQAPERVR